jgi:hypothetical protein
MDNLTIWNMIPLIGGIMATGRCRGHFVRAVGCGGRHCHCAGAVLGLCPAGAGPGTGDESGGRHLASDCCRNRIFLGARASCARLGRYGPAAALGTLDGGRGIMWGHSCRCGLWPRASGAVWHHRLVGRMEHGAPEYPHSGPRPADQTRHSTRYGGQCRGDLGHDGCWIGHIGRAADDRVFGAGASRGGHSGCAGAGDWPACVTCHDLLRGLGVEGRPPASVGYVNLVAVALILPLSIACAPLGARIAHALKPVWIKRAFAVFLCLTSLRMLWSALG